MTTVRPVLRLLLVGLMAALPFVGAIGATQPSRASAGAVADSCSWDRPGHDPYMGDVPGALDHYSDLSPETRQRLRARMLRRDYDDVVTIRRDRIVGKSDKAQYGSAIHDMHFGPGRMCRSVSRAKWTDAMEERGLVYCESGECILVPTVCRNVSRIDRAEVGDDRATAPPEIPLVAIGPVDDGVAGLPRGGPIGQGETPPSFASTVGPLAAPPGAGDTGGLYPGAPWPSGGGVIGGGGGGGGGGNGSGGGDNGSNPLPPGGGSSGPGGTVPAVPEPETWALLGLGMTLAIVASSRRRRRAAEQR